MKPIFKAKDGSEHATAEAAQLKNDLLKVCHEFQEAGDSVRRMLGNSALTADGQPFNCRGMNRFWWVAEWAGWPHLKEFDVYWYQAHVEHRDYSGESRLTLQIDHPDRKEKMWFPIHELYASKRAAEQALIKACEEKLAEYTAQLEDLKQRVSR